MRGVVGIMILAVFITVTFLISIGFVVRMIFVPSLDVYGEVQADLLAKSLANDISSLSTQEQGNIERSLGGQWTILFSENNKVISVSHGEFQSNEMPILGNVQGDFDNLFNVEKIVIEKTGEGITISEVA